MIKLDAYSSIPSFIEFAIILAATFACSSVNLPSWVISSTNRCVLKLGPLMERFRRDVWKLLMHLLPNISKCRLIVLWNPVDGDYVDNRNAIVYEIHRRGDEVAEKVYFITPVFFLAFLEGK